MLKRFSVLILSAATLAACSESMVQPDAPQTAPSGHALLTELTCKADVAAQRLSCAPAAPTLARGVSADLIIGGQNTYTTLTSTNVVTTGTTSLTADVTVQNLTGQPWATANGSTANGNGVRVFFHTLPTNGVTVNNPDGTSTFTATGQPYFQYSGADLGVDNILASGEVSSSKSWKFDLNGASSFSFQVYVTTQLPDEGGVLLWTPSTVAQAGVNENINAIWGASSSDIWIAGKAGANVLQHWNGTSWSSFAGAESGDMVALWGSGSSDVYVGEANVYHWNGSSWSNAGAGISGVRAIWGTSPSDVWVGGTSGNVVHYDGTSWSAPITVGSSDVGGIWGTSTSDVYLVNRAGSIWHYNGSNWVRYRNPLDSYVGVWGSGRTDVWVVGADAAFQNNKVYHGTR